MTQLEEIYQLQADYRKRTGDKALVKHWGDGTGVVVANTVIIGEWTFIAQTMDVIRLALAPPLPTKEEVLKAITGYIDACGKGPTTVLDLVRRYIESTEVELES